MPCTARSAAGWAVPLKTRLREFEQLQRRKREQEKIEQERRAALAARSSYFTGMMLQADDLRREQEYLAASRGTLDGRVIANPKVVLPPIALPSRELTCFCIDFFAVGHLEQSTFAGKPVLIARLDGFEIVDLRPEGLENSLECYISALVRLTVLPRVNIEISKVFPVADLFTVALALAPVSAALPNSPAIEDDQAKVFINLTTSPPPPPSPPGPPGPPAPARTITWSPAGPPGPGGSPHLVAAVSEKAVGKLFDGVRDNFTKSAADTVNFGPFSAGYDIELALDNGSVDLRSDGKIKLSELDIKFNKLKFMLGFDIPKIGVGGQCIIPTPWGCALRLPKVCVFSADPDISLTLDLAPFVRLEFSMLFELLSKYGIEATRPAGLLDVDAKALGIPNLWGIFLHLNTLDVDLFDIADIVGDLLENALTSAVNNLLPGPQWLKDAILAILGPIIDLIRGILDIADDFQEWLSDLLGVSLGLLDFIGTLLVNHFAGGSPLAKIEDPLQVAEADGSLVPIMIPIRDLALAVDDKELVVRGSVGA